MNRRLEFEIGFDADPDGGAGASAEESASWGWFKLIVGEQNLCQHIVNDTLADRVHWYLLPMLEWLVENWDPLLHETKLPSPFADALSARLGFRTFNPFKVFTESCWPEEEEDMVFQWSQRHSVRASSAGGLFPDVFLRRVQNELEISWGNSPIAGAPSDLKFVVGPGQAYFPVKESALNLFKTIFGAVQLLRDKCPESQRISKLDDDLRAIQHTTNLDRAAWMAGVGPTLETSKLMLRVLAERVKVDHRSLLEPLVEPLVISRAPAAVLMFGSLSPVVKQEDVNILVELLEEAFDGERVARFPALGEPAASPLPHEQGYEMAVLAQEQLGISERPFRRDVRGLLERYGVALKNVALSDVKIRAIAIAGEQLRPILAVNKSCAQNDTEPGLRFTLAHELCHFLFDQEKGAPLAVASGPWAPALLEKRANAFAAMFLMPEESCRLLVERYSSNVALTTSAIAEIAAAFATSKLATLRHLSNLNLVDSAEAEALEEQLVH